MKEKNHNIAVFKNLIWKHYKAYARKDLPWRKQITPYKVFVSEVMLQQTQVDRVVPKFLEFVKKFPDFHALASASQKDVLRLWKGLGYNSRALRLKKAAEIIVEKHKGRLPKAKTSLEAFPGIGPYTAGAIRSFAFNEPDIFIETNIRRVFIYHFFKRKKVVHDKEIMRHIEITLDGANPREWFFALMDYGSFLARTIKNPNRKSRHYNKQSKFKGSNRQIRGQILKFLLEENSVSLENLILFLKTTKKRGVPIVLDLVKEGFVENSRGIIRLL